MKPAANITLINIILITLALLLVNAVYFTEVRHEGARRARAGQDAALKTFWQLLHSQGDRFELKEGSLLLGNQRLDSRIPDIIQETFGCTASIYQGKVRVATSRPNQLGERRSGAEISGTIFSKVFVRKLPYRGKNLIDGQLYFSAYDPILDPEGHVVGAISVELNSSEFFSGFDHLRNDVIYGSLFIEFVLVLVSIFFFREYKQQEQLLIENENSYDLLFSKMLNGSALHEVIYNAAGKPVDYRFLQTNAAFDHHTGLKGEELIGRTVREVLPDIEDFWIQRYGAVATSEGTDHFERYVKELGRWFEVSAYCPRKGQFVSMIADITQRKQAQQALLDSEDRYRTLFDTTGTATILIEEDTTISLANREFENLCQYSRQELATGMSFSGFFDPESQSKMLNFHRQRRIDPSLAPSVYECILLRKDGSSRHLLAYVSLIPGSGRSIASLHDITLLKALENSLQEQVAFLQTLIDTIPNPVFFKDRTGRYLGYNKAFESFVGMSREDLIGKTVFDVSPPALARKYFDMDEELFNRPGIQTYGAPVRYSDGSQHEVVFYKATFNNRAGAVGGLVGVMLDVTELKRSEAALRESEDRFHQLFTQHPDAVILLKAGGDALLDANPVAAAMFGYEQDEFLSCTLSHLLEQMDSPPPLPVDFRFEKIMAKRRDGSLFFVSLWGKTIQLHDNHVIFCSIRDVTEKIQMEEAIKSTQAKLIHTNKMTSLGILTSSMGHEINNPNSYIAVNAAMLTDIWTDSLPVLRRYFIENGDFSLGGLPFSEMESKVPRLCNGIKEGSQRIDAIVKGLKNFVRDEKGRRHEKASINSIVEQAAGILWHHIHKHTNHFHLALGENLPEVRGNTQQLEQVVINLVMNALQSLPDKQAGVSVATRQEDQTIVVEVRDGGTGMTAAVLKNLTEPFFTTRIEEGGSGLGLYISASIIDEHQGMMAFDSTPGVGTTAVIRLPLAG